jgi:hypothetical protein
VYAQAVEASNRSSETLWNWGLLQLAADDEIGYRATCTELLNLYGNINNPHQALNIAVACVVGDNADGSMSKVVALAKQSAKGFPSASPAPMALLGAAQFRAGQTEEAISALKKSLPGYTMQALATPKLLDQIQFSRLIGETILALAYNKAGDKEELAKQLTVVNGLIAQLKKSPPEPSGSFPPWAIPFAIEMAKRELARIEPPATESTESNPK